MIFGMSIVNTYFIYKENDDTSRMTMLQFRESLVGSSLIGVLFENLKPGPRERSRSRMKRRLTDQNLEKIEGSDRDLRRRCGGCYVRIRQQQSKKASNAIAKKVKPFCPDCNKFNCIGCFNEKHHPTQ